MPYLEVLQKYAQFGGRSPRCEFWPFALLHTGIAYFLLALALRGSMLALLFGILAFAYAVALLIPSLAVLARRLHDTGRSAWWILIGLVPVASLILLVFALLPSQDANGYGSRPEHNPDVIRWVVGIAGLALMVISVIMYSVAISNLTEPYSGF